MKNYFVWFKIDGDIENEKKAKYSKSIHDFIFKNGIKLKTKSNAFFYKSNDDMASITDKIVQMSNKKIKLLVVRLDTYQGWLEKSQWDFLEK